MVDIWGKGFVDELDYISEAKNAENFMSSLQSTPLQNVVFAPYPIMEYCTNSVLTTEWIDGERLDVSTQDDVTVLCSVAMNTYLTMMLETGTLHCDPHPVSMLIIAFIIELKITLKTLLMIIKHFLICKRVIYYAHLMDDCAY